MAQIKKTFTNIYGEIAYIMSDHTVALEDGTIYATDSEREAVEKIRSLGYR